MVAPPRENRIFTPSFDSTLRALIFNHMSRSRFFTWATISSLASDSHPLTYKKPRTSCRSRDALKIPSVIEATVHAFMPTSQAITKSFPSTVLVTGILDFEVACIPMFRKVAKTPARVNLGRLNDTTRSRLRALRSLSLWMTTEPLNTATWGLDHEFMEA